MAFSLKDRLLETLDFVKNLLEKKSLKDTKFVYEGSFFIEDLYTIQQCIDKKFKNCKTDKKMPWRFHRLAFPTPGHTISRTYVKDPDDGDQCRDCLRTMNVHLKTHHDRNMYSFLKITGEFVDQFARKKCQWIVHSTSNYTAFDNVVCYPTLSCTHLPFLSTERDISSYADIGVQLGKGLDDVWFVTDRQALVTETEKALRDNQISADVVKYIGDFHTVLPCDLQDKTILIGIDRKDCDTFYLKTKHNETDKTFRSKLKVLQSDERFGDALSTMKHAIKVLEFIEKLSKHYPNLAELCAVCQIMPVIELNTRTTKPNIKDTSRCDSILKYMICENCVLFTPDTSNSEDRKDWSILFEVVNYVNLCIQMLNLLRYPQQNSTVIPLSSTWRPLTKQIEEIKTLLKKEELKDTLRHMHYDSVYPSKICQEVYAKNNFYDILCITPAPRWRTAKKFYKWHEVINVATCFNAMYFEMLPRTLSIFCNDGKCACSGDNQVYKEKNIYNALDIIRTMNMVYSAGLPLVPCLDCRSLSHKHYFDLLYCCDRQSNGSNPEDMNKYYCKQILDNIAGSLLITTDTIPNFRSRSNTAAVINGSNVHEYTSLLLPQTSFIVAAVHLHYKAKTFDINWEIFWKWLYSCCSLRDKFEVSLNSLKKFCFSRTQFIADDDIRISIPYVTHKSTLPEKKNFCIETLGCLSMLLHYNDTFQALVTSLQTTSLIMTLESHGENVLKPAYGVGTVRHCMEMLWELLCDEKVGLFRLVAGNFYVPTEEMLQSDEKLRVLAQGLFICYLISYIRDITCKLNLHPYINIYRPTKKCPDEISLPKALGYLASAGTEDTLETVRQHVNMITNPNDLYKLNAYSLTKYKNVVWNSLKTETYKLIPEHLLTCWQDSFTRNFQNVARYASLKLSMPKAYATDTNFDTTYCTFFFTTRSRAMTECSLTSKMILAKSVIRHKFRPVAEKIIDSLSKSELINFIRFVIGKSSLTNKDTIIFNFFPSESNDTLKLPSASTCSSTLYFYYRPNWTDEEKIKKLTEMLRKSILHCDYFGVM